MTGSAEIELPNDEAIANFYFEAQDADLAKAQALVNQRVGDGTAALKRADAEGPGRDLGLRQLPGLWGAQIAASSAGAYAKA